jgi:2-isopropylmalate synthase
MNGVSDPDYVVLYDTTLRDGAQTYGVDFSVGDKQAIAQALDDLGIDYVEGGWPGANPTDDAFFGAPPALKRAKLTPFGMTRRDGRSAANDPGLNAVLDAARSSVCLVGKTWDFHVDVALGIPREDNLRLIRESFAEAKGRGLEAIFDAEHFFDGYKANPEYALACLKSAVEGGAGWLVLCDTNGGTLPHEIERIVGDVKAAIPVARLGIHAHDDTENAVANSLAAVRAGARMVQGTLNGLGERCGNANLISLIPTLKLKMGFACGVSDAALGRLVKVSRLLDDRLNRAPRRNAAYVGTSAFAHKGGLHVSAIAKDPSSYEHIDPVVVGNRREVLVSDQAGRSNVLQRLADAGVEIDSKNPAVNELVREVKEREFAGYSYDSAEASFELLARRVLGQVPEYFRLISFRVIDERRFNARGELVTMSEATVKVEVQGEPQMMVAEGNGPVNALDQAIRRVLLPHYPVLAGVHLDDYRVRIISPHGGTEAVTRVSIESADDAGHRWRTVGISGNIIDASYNALHDSLSYYLFRNAGHKPDVNDGNGKLFAVT